MKHLLPSGPFGNARHTPIPLPELPQEPTEAEFNEFMQMVGIAMEAETFFCQYYAENWRGYQLQFTPELPLEVKNILFGTDGLNWIVDNYDDGTSYVRIHHLWEYMLSDPTWDRKAGAPKYGISDCALVAKEIEQSHHSATLADIRRAILHKMQIAFWSGENEVLWTTVIPKEIKTKLTDAGFDVFQSSRYACSISYAGLSHFHRNGLFWLIELLKNELDRCLADKLPLNRFKVTSRKNLSTEQKAFLKKLHFRVYGSTIRLPKNFREILDAMEWPMPQDSLDGAVMAHRISGNPVCIYIEEPPLYTELMEHFIDCLNGNVRPEQFCFVTTKKLSLEDINHLRARNFDVVSGANYSTIALFQNPVHDPMSYFDGACLAYILRKSFSTEPADILLMLETLSKMQNCRSSIYHKLPMPAKQSPKTIKLENVIICSEQMTGTMVERFPGGVIIPHEPLTNYLKEHGWEIQRSVGPFDPKKYPLASFLGWSIFTHSSK